MMFSKVICVFDEDVDVQNPGEVVWRMLANLDPKRDISFVDGPIDQLDHGANQALYGSKMCIDATRKWREEGYTRDWPEVCSMTPAVQQRVDELWPSLGLGAGAPAPREVMPTASWQLQMFDGLTAKARALLESKGSR